MERRLPPPLPSERVVETPRAEPPPLPTTTTTTVVTTTTTTTTGTPSAATPSTGTPPPVPKPSAWEQIQKTVGDASKCVQGVSQVFSFLEKHLGSKATSTTPTSPTAPAPNLPQAAVIPTDFGPPVTDMGMGYDPGMVTNMGMSFDPNMMMGFDPNMAAL